MLKSFTIDIESEEECLKLINVLKSHLGQIRLNNCGISKIDRRQQIFEACLSIMETPIDHIYFDQPLDETPKYYVYAHLDTTKRIAIGKDGRTSFAATLGMEFFPFYIGKGTGTRAYDINRNETHRKVRERLSLFGYAPAVQILKDGLTEVQALSMESKLIDIFGLIANKGRLTNLDEGCKKGERRALYKSQLNVISQLYRNSV